MLVKNIVNYDLENPSNETIARFKAFLIADGKSQGTIAGYLRIIRDLVEFFPKINLREITRNNLEAYLADWANRTSNRVKGKSLDELGNGRTQKTSAAYLNFIRVVVKFFFKWLDGTDTYPECVKWIKTKKIKQELDPATILTAEEVYSMIVGTTNSQEKALIHVLYETGGRIGEIQSRKVGDVTFEEIEGFLTVKLSIPQRATKGKGKGKYLRLIDSAKILRKWLGKHPKPQANQPLWVTLQGRYAGNPMSTKTIRRMLKRVAKTVGITKPVNPHAFRHAQVTASATYMVDQELKKKFGWTAGSQMLQTYAHLTDQAVENKELEMRGITKVKGHQKRILTHVKCERCGKIYSAGKTLCECGRPLDPDLAARWDQEKAEQEGLLTEFVTEISQTDPATLKQIIALLKTAKKP